MKITISNQNVIEIFPQNYSKINGNTREKKLRFLSNAFPWGQFDVPKMWAPGCSY